MMGLSELVAALREDRRAVEALKLRVTEAQTRLEQTAEWAALAEYKEFLQRAKFAAEQDELAVRDEAEALYRQNGDKHPHPHIGIRVSRVPRYDAQVVCAWLRDNAPAYLTVDTKRFEKVADGLPGAPVTWEEKVTATIATDLGEGEA